MTLAQMIWMNCEPVDEGRRRSLRANQNTDRIGPSEGDHAAAAPDLEVADRPLERRGRHRRVVGKVRGPAAIQRVNKQLDVVGATEAVRGHDRSTTDQASPEARALIWLTSFRYPLPLP